jgi:large subunit ribosomal protein L30
MKKVKITQVRSVHGRLPSHKATVYGLGLRRMYHSIELKDTPETRGMINKVSYLLKIEEVQDEGK